jgi:hypothetical protein
MESELPVNPTTMTNSSPPPAGVRTSTFNIRNGPAEQARGVSGGSSSRLQIIPKPPSQWRKGEASHNPPYFRGDLLIAQGNTAATVKPRSASLNPLIYPQWWGDNNEDFDKAIMRKERSQVNITRVYAPKPGSKTRNGMEDSLERRL